MKMKSTASIALLVLCLSAGGCVQQRIYTYAGETYYSPEECLAAQERITEQAIKTVPVAQRPIAGRLAVTVPSAAILERDGITMKSGRRQDFSKQQVDFLVSSTLKGYDGFVQAFRKSGLFTAVEVLPMGTTPEQAKNQGFDYMLRIYFPVPQYDDWELTNLATGKAESVHPRPQTQLLPQAAYRISLDKLSYGVDHLQQLSPSPPPEEPLGQISDRWAVVVGINHYQYAGQRLPNLRFARRDAEEFAKFLISEAGGSFPNSHIKLLTDETATVTNIRQGLFDFLKRTVKEDLVIIYFSGHGMPDPDKPSNLYFVAYDSHPEKIASTGFPMWDLDTALTRTVAAQRVVVLADACHSAATAQGIKGIKVSGQFNSYFDELAKSKPGRVFLTSCEGYEFSREDEKWGGGHGVFTWSLLEGLRGSADSDKDGFVRLGEIMDYVDITVRRETANEQHPTKAAVQFDRNLPMGVVK
jgi:hypothetical protein